MKIIKSWYCLCGPRQKNFGDKLTKILIEHLTDYKVEMAPRKERERCQLIGIGSILHVCHPYSPGIIWSTGFMRDYHRRRLTSANVLAVRGQLTLDRIKLRKDKSKVVLGDGGLLCHTLVNSKPPKKYKLGIIPHFIDQKDEYVENLIKESGVKFIDICADHMEVINEVQQCEYILSSSLHGIILADSLQIPNDWIELSDKIHGEGFKYRDYYSVFGIKGKKPFDIKARKQFKGIMKYLENMEYKRPGLEKIQKKLLNTLKMI